MKSILKAHACFWSIVIWIALGIFIWTISASLSHGQIDKDSVWLVLALTIIIGPVIAYYAEVVTFHLKKGGKP